MSIFKNIVCDSCYENFYLRKEDIKRVQIGPDLYILHYRCKKCGRLYIICRLNKHLIDLQEEIANAKKCNNAKQLKRLQKKFKEELDKFNGVQT